MPQRAPTIPSCDLNWRSDGRSHGSTRRNRENSQFESSLDFKGWGLHSCHHPPIRVASSLLPIEVVDLLYSLDSV
ncbi:hypothetical protein CDL15_Pgr017956 [Punica granatum]|uniref:Uncharacterized protein n=1 Tax=Punica granatum TaxID=22663 RepID=A0A218WHN8_PUNGR|nr:hypothetical protein CDL15_Pgr017956 [Punica granatum]